MFFHRDLCMFVVAIRVEKVSQRTKIWSASHEVIGNISSFQISHSIFFILSKVRLDVFVIARGS